MNPPAENPNRRQFVKAVGAGVGSLAALSQVKCSFSERLEELSLSGSKIDDIRAAYGLKEGIVYFNHASIGTMPTLVLESLSAYTRLCETNPWLHVWGEAWKEQVDDVRHRVGQLLGVPSERILLNHNTTEGFNLLASGLPLGEGDEVVFSSLNHTGASECWRHGSKRRGYSVREFEFPLEDVPSLSEEDIIDLYAQHLGERSKVLVFPDIDNRMGLRHPVAALARKARSLGVEYVAVDGAQSLGMIPVDGDNMGIDFYATSPHKWVQGPKGTGIAYISEKVEEVLEPMWVTWGQKKYRGTLRIFEDYGTRNWATLLALGDAVDFQRRIDETFRDQRYRWLFEAFLLRVEADPRLAWLSPKTFERGASLYTIQVLNKPNNFSYQDLFETMFQSRGMVFRPFDQKRLQGMRLSPNLTATEAEIDSFFVELSTILDRA